MARLYDREHNPVWRHGISGDAARDLLAFWRAVDPDTGTLRITISPILDWDTRFLGDLYQDLSDEAKKRFALLQTPEFVEEFILGRTLTPALDEFGLADLRLIDPACGSGHFLLGAFPRLLNASGSRASREHPNVCWFSVPSMVSMVSTSTRSRRRSPGSVCWCRRCARAVVERLREAPNFRIQCRRSVTVCCTVADSMN